MAHVAKTLVEDLNEIGSVGGGAVSMRLRPQEQNMFKEIAQAYGLYGTTNAVRAAGRVLVAMGLDNDSFLSLLLRYEKEHPECVPCGFRPVKEE